MYSNVAFKHEQPLTSHSATKQLFVEEDDDVILLQKQIAVTEEHLINEWNLIRQAINYRDIDRVMLSTVQYHSLL